MPPLHRALVDARGQQCGSVRCPPVAAQPSHLLRRHELGETIGDLTAFWRGEHAVRARPGGVLGSGGQVGNPQGTAADVRDAPAVRIGTRIERRVVHGYLADPWTALADQIGHVHASRQGKDGDAQFTVAGVADDSARLFPGPFPARPLLRRQVLIYGAEFEGVRGKALGAAAGIEHPQAVHWIGAAAAAQECHPAAVWGDVEGARHAEGEAAGGGVLARETLGHACRSFQVRG